MSVPFYVSPEQLTQDKAEFARKGIARGKPIVALDYEQGIVMIAENRKNNEETTPPTELIARLDQIRERGYEIMTSMQTAGVHNLSAPVLGPDGAAIAALTCPYITLVNSPDAPDISQTIELVVKAARELSALAGANAV